MLLRFLIVFLLFPFVKLTSLPNKRQETIERVRNYLRKAEVTSRTLETTPWLENSNKIGFGYNLLSGSPVCYTGKCQSTGFTRSIFKLNYTSPVPGSCTNKLVPNNVDLDCLPSTSLQIDTEMVDTIEKLHRSISDKVTVSTGARYYGIGFSYQHSKETQYMLDTIVKKQQVSILTETQISYAKLSMFERKMELSENFKYVIENLYCDEENDPDIEQYIKEFIFEYYGFTFVSSILLGGVARQHITISQEAKEKLEKQSVDISNAAKLSFNLLNYGAEAGVNVGNTQEMSNYQKFVKEVQSNFSTTLGGDVQLTTLSQWSKTVPSNPVIIEFVLQDIMRLFTRNYFPTDPLITNKSRLIEQVLQKYINGSAYCYNNCGGNGIRGTCEPSGYFQFGVCRCKPGWSGFDCSTPERPKMSKGTLCGFDRSTMQILCNGQRPSAGCPNGWDKYYWEVDLAICYNTLTKVDDPVRGTLCGLHSEERYSNSFNYDIGCNGVMNVHSGTCPLGYYRYATSVQSGYSQINGVCAVLDSKELPSGTLCGLQVQNTIRGPSCEDLDPGLGQCPPDYTLQYTAFKNLGFMVCVKK